MAYKSFNQRFPTFKWVLLFAVLLTLPLTVFSVQHVSTNVQQHASTYTCGPNNTNPACPSGYTCSYIQGNPTFGGTCYLNAPSSAPILNKGTYSTCTNYGETFTSKMYFSWSSVPRATGYIVTWYDTVYGNLVGKNSKKVTTTSTSIYPSISWGARFYWNVRAYNSTSTGPVSPDQQMYFSCNTIAK